MKKIITNSDLKQFKQLFIENISNIVNGKDNIYCSLSGGIDSCLIFFSLMELGVDFKAVTFRTDEYLSKDFTTSKKISSQFEKDFIEVVLPSDPNSLIEVTKDVINVTGKRKKTIVECCYPYVFVSKRLPKNSLLLTGLGADDMYCNQRKVAVELHKHGEEHILKYRQNYSSHPDFTGYNIMKIGRHYNNIEIVDCYQDKSIVDYFRTFEVKALNRKHKLLSVGAFHEWFNLIGGYREHSSFQINSKLDKTFEKLLHSKYNTSGNKSVVGIYNKL